MKLIWTGLAQEKRWKLRASFMTIEDGCGSGFALALLELKQETDHGQWKEYPDKKRALATHA